MTDVRSGHAIGRLFVAWAVVALIACTSWPTRAQTPAASMLNSERIEMRFGSYGIEVLSSDETIRVSNLYSTDSESGRQTTRTFALVEYPARVRSDYYEEHAAILAGGSIGATFSASGWKVLKSNLWFGEIGSTGRLETMMRLVGPSRLAVHVYELEVERSGSRLPYARIVEVHHPDYLSLEWVQAIYAPEWAGGGRTEVAGLLDVLDRTIR